MMKSLVLVAAIWSIMGCRASPVAIEAGAPESIRDAGHEAVPIASAVPARPAPPSRPTRPDAGRHPIFGSSQPGRLHREDNFVDDDSGITTIVSDNTATGQADITVHLASVPVATIAPCSNGQVIETVSGAQSCQTLSAGVSSVTGAGTVSCSPTTGAVTCTGTDAVSSVTGTSGVSCSPTTGAVSCSNTGVRSVTGGTGISCSPTTGASTCTNTGATSVTGAGATSCSPTSGAVTCTTSNTVGNGLTGLTSCAAGDYVSGNGSSPFICTAGTQHQVALFEGTFPPGGAGPGTVGQVLTSNGASADPSFQAPVTQLGGFIDYVTGTTPTLTTSIQTAAFVAESITFPRPVIVDASWICYDGVETNGLEVGVNVDTSSSFLSTGSIAGLGLGASAPGTGAPAAGLTTASQHVYFGGLSTASHTFYFLAATSLTSGYAAKCTVQAVIHF